MRYPRRPSFSLTLTVVIVALALVVALLFVLRRDQGIRARQETASDRVFRSALLPDEGWITYGADVWSFGYPNDWTVQQDADGITVIHPSTNEIYLTISEETRTVGAMSMMYQSDASVTKSEFLFAGYPATKFTHRNGREEYYVEYNARLFAITTDIPTEVEVGIMLATFRFVY